LQGDQCRVVTEKLAGAMRFQQVQNALMREPQLRARRCILFPDHENIRKAFVVRYRTGRVIDKIAQEGELFRRFRFQTLMTESVM
jgi:hypothetical protein